MSVDITISNNRSYLEANSPEQIRLEPIDPDIGEGLGLSGMFKVYPFELNFANGNFYRLFSALGIYPGLDADQCGSIQPKLLLEKLNPRVIDKLVCPDTTEGNYTQCGIHREQASRYYWDLSQLALEAERRNELIVWY